jgi:hypothetical protein
MPSWKKPTPETVDRATSLLVHGQQHAHFFENLQNPEWLEPLQKKGFFGSPPKPVQDESRTSISFPPWPELGYLARMAKIAPGIVSDIVSKIPETENIRVHDGLIDVAIALPPDLAAKIVPQAVGWIRAKYHLFLPQKLGELMSYLATSGQITPALRLAKGLLAVEPDPNSVGEANEETAFLLPKPRALFSLRHYRQVLEKNVPDLVKHAGFKALDLLCELLERAVQFSQKGDENSPPDDYSYIWHPVIEQTEQMKEGVPVLLVSTVRDASIQLGRQSSGDVGEIIEKLEGRPWRIFHRIALDVLRVLAGNAQELVAERLRDPERFDNSHLRREYNRLAGEQFGRLSKADQNLVYEWINAGPNIDEYKKLWSLHNEGAPSDDHVKSYSSRWQRDRLHPIVPYLSEDWKHTYGELVGEVGPWEDEGTSHERVAYWSGSSSPTTTEELERKTLDDLFSYLRTWVPLGGYFEASRPGLGNALGALVRTKSEEFSNEAERFVGLDPTYVRSMLQALWESAKQKSRLNWLAVLKLCQWVVQQPREIADRKGGIGDQDPDWSWTRKAIANLLLLGFDHGGIPIELRALAWSILKPLTDDPHPGLDQELKESSYQDFANFSINTVRGEAMHAVCSYAVWVSRSNDERGGTKNHVSRSLDEIAEVREILERHLDPVIDPSPTIRSVYGQWLPTLHYLDPAWTKANLSKIFPAEPGLEILRHAAWKTYVSYSKPFDDVFKILEEQYRDAIDRIREPAGGNKRRPDQDEHLAQHLVTQYWLGNLNLSDQQSLFARFFEKAGLKLRKYLIRYVGIALHNTKESIRSDILQRLQNLWQVRVRAVRSSGQPTQDVEELVEFGWWFSSGKFPAQWGIDQFLELLALGGSIDPERLAAEQLAKLSDTMPAKAVECARKIVERDLDGWGIRTWREQARTIISFALASVEESARQEAINLIHYLGSRGYPEFRDLLPS